MNITVKREKLDTAEQTRQSTKECEYMIIDRKAENLYNSEEVIEIEHLDKEETMDKETERRMMAKFHRKIESSIKLMGTHWYIKDGKGGVNPTVLVKLEAVYIKKFWEAELKKRDKNTSSLAASAQNPKSRTPLVTPTKKPKKVMKKVEFVPLSSIKMRSKSRSPTKRKVTNLDAEEWLTPKEALPQTKRKSSPKIQTSEAQHLTLTKDNPITINKRPSKQKPTQCKTQAELPPKWIEESRS